MKKKAQIAQVFIYILALFIFALIIYYGYYSISSFIKKGEEVTYIKFKTQLESEVEAILPQFGSVSIFSKNKPLKAPGNVEKVCFVSYNNVVNKMIPSEPSDTIDPVTRLSIEQGTEENVFLFPREERAPISLLRIRVTNDFDCIPVKQGRLDIRLESEGNLVRITEYIE
ncbi:hypothetical protein KY343_00660 [Candidatus Woesearchaeota archaeon]|nr:hypothetical protein [Candidatus Woesearchaeota archaeon]